VSAELKPPGEKLAECVPELRRARLDEIESGSGEFIEISEDAYKQNSVYSPWEKGSSLERLVGRQ
jgi:hypothetical protein